MNPQTNSISRPKIVGAGIRIPHGSPKSIHAELRLPAPDCNPYFLFWAIGQAAEDSDLNATEVPIDKDKAKIFPTSLGESVTYFEYSSWIKKHLPPELREGYISLKRETADRSPKLLPPWITAEEVVLHHLIANQQLWGRYRRGH